MLDFSIKNYYNINDLVKILKLLRSENGCPWDKVQTHESIRNNFIEEVYEAIEAIDKNDVELLKEELGDVLLQVVFHSEIEDELSHFSFEDVVNDICSKLIIRHPHVFSDLNVSGTSEVLANWEAIKNKTKGTKSYTETLKNVPAVLPSLMRASKISDRASKAGMDFPDKKSAFSSLISEIDELDCAIKANNIDDISDELGDVLFSSVNVARKFGISSEEALTRACEKFISRFEKVEELTRLDGKDMKSLSIDELDAYWKKAKIKI